MLAGKNLLRSEAQQGEDGEEKTKDGWELKKLLSHCRGKRVPRKRTDLSAGEQSRVSVSDKYRVDG